MISDVDAGANGGFGERDADEKLIALQVATIMSIVAATVSPTEVFPCESGAGLRLVSRAW